MGNCEEKDLRFKEAKAFFARRIALACETL